MDGRTEEKRAGEASATTVNGGGEEYDDPIQEESLLVLRFPEFTKTSYLSGRTELRLENLFDETPKATLTADGKQYPMVGSHTESVGTQLYFKSGVKSPHPPGGGATVAASASSGSIEYVGHTCQVVQFDIEHQLRWRGTANIPQKQPASNKTATTPSSGQHLTSVDPQKDGR